jgi:hypothetical protein
MAARIKEPDELWELERLLTQRRKQTDAKYEFKYSALLLVLADLVREGRINPDELNGLGEDKLRIIRNHEKEPVPEDDHPVKCKTWFGTVPPDKFVDGVTV